MNVNDYSPLTLAFIGDAHYNLVVKRYAIDQKVKSNDLQKIAAHYCSAKCQAKYAAYLIDNQLLSEEEVTIYKRGRNAKSHNAPKNTDAVTYRVATGFETLWGYWYLNDETARMEQVWNIIKTLEEG